MLEFLGCLRIVCVSKSFICQLQRKVLFKVIWAFWSYLQVIQKNSDWDYFYCFPTSRLRWYRRLRNPKLRLADLWMWLGMENLIRLGEPHLSYSFHPISELNKTNAKFGILIIFCFIFFLDLSYWISWTNLDFTICTNLHRITFCIRVCSDFPISWLREGVKQINYLAWIFHRALTRLPPFRGK